MGDRADGAADAPPDPPVAPPVTIENILQIIQLTARENQEFAQSVRTSSTALNASMQDVADATAATARSVGSFVTDADARLRAVQDVATSMQNQSAQNTAAIEAMRSAVRAIESHAIATAPAGGGTPGAPSAGASSGGFWINEPDTDPTTGAYTRDTLVDPNCYRLPSSSKTLTTEDVMKAEQKMASMLSGKPPLRYDKRYSFQYNVDTFFLGIRSGLKRELRDYWSAQAMYEGSNARELGKMAITLQWEEEWYQEAPVDSRDGAFPVLSMDPTTLVPIPRQVNASLFARFNSLHGITLYSHSPSYIIPDPMWNASKEEQAHQLTVKANKRLREPFKRRTRDFTEKELTVQEPLHHFRDYGQRYDNALKRYVQNNPTFVGNSSAPSADNFATIARAIGELFHIFLGPDNSGREHLDCMPTVAQIMRRRHTLPNLYKLLENEVHRTTSTDNGEKVRILKQFKDILLQRFQPFKVRYKHAVSMLQENNTEIWKFGDKESQFSEQTLIVDLMERSINWYRNIQEGERSGYLLGLQRLVDAWEKRDTDWAQSKANLEFRGVFKSLMSIQQYAVDLEAKHPRDVAHLPIDLPSYLTSSNKWPDTPAPGTVMAMWLGDDNYAIPNFDSQSHLYFSGESHPAALAPAEHPDDVANRLLYSGRQPDDEVDDDFQHLLTEWSRQDAELFLTDRRHPPRLQQDPYFNPGAPRPDAPVAAHGPGRGGVFRHFDSGRGGGRSSHRGGRNDRGRGQARGGQSRVARFGHVASRNAFGNRIKRELQNEQRRDAQRAVRRAPPGGMPTPMPGAGAHRRNEHPHSKAQQKHPGTDWIPSQTYRGITKVERSLDEALQGSPSVESLKAAIRSGIAELRASRTLHAKPSALVCLTTGETIDVDESADLEPHERVQQEMSRPAQAERGDVEDGIVMPMEDNGEDEGFSGVERTFLHTLLQRHPDIREWSWEQQEALVESALDNPSTYALGLGLTTTENEETPWSEVIAAMDDPAHSSRPVDAPSTPGVPEHKQADGTELDFQLEIADGDHDPLAAQRNAEAFEATLVSEPRDHYAAVDGAFVADGSPSGKPLAVDDLSSFASVSPSDAKEVALDASSVSGSSTWTPVPTHGQEDDSEADEPFVPPPSPQRQSPSRRAPDASSPPRLSRRLAKWEHHPRRVQLELLKPCSRPGCPCTTRSCIVDSMGHIIRVQDYCCRSCAGVPRKPGVEPRPGRPCLACDHDQEHRSVEIRRNQSVGRHFIRSRIGKNDRRDSDSASLSST